ncbi:hypothetical protein [Streptomyces zagrosensis]|uniref:YwqI/YxiC family protein n=1 Tax=Streptomyces zagrosensis TaxID=1042984 RepID=A0A7W9V1Q6_9ACTN|nr:hypothetical protein [Streptomyces zagrosensis]MBB5939450.1 hypothetical protein [Streptomyces zagrosensis]
MNEEMVTLAGDDAAGQWVGAVGAGGTFLLLIVIVWQIAVTWRSRMLAAREEQYKQLALKYAQLLEDNTELHRRTLDELSQARLSLDSMEKMMREVE